MTISDLLATRNSRYARDTDPTTTLLIALSDIQEELKRLQINVSAPDIDLSGLESAIKELRDGFPGPVPPQNLDLNPVLRSYEDTARILSELLGEVKTTNTRISGIRSGGGGPSSVGIRDESTGYKLAIDSNGAIAVTGITGQTDALTNTQLRAAPVPISGTVTANLGSINGAATEATLSNLPDLTGTWGYSAGVSGTPSLPPSSRIIGIAAIAGTTAASLSINSGDSIPIPVNISLSLTPHAQLISPTLTFTDTASYTVEYLT